MFEFQIFLYKVIHNSKISKTSLYIKLICKIYRKIKKVPRKNDIIFNYKFYFKNLLIFEDLIKILKNIFIFEKINQPSWKIKNQCIIDLY